MEGPTQKATILNDGDVSLVGTMKNLSLNQKQGERTIGEESIPENLQNQEWFFNWLKGVPLSKWCFPTTAEGSDNESCSVGGLLVSNSDWETKIYEALKLLFYLTLSSDYKKAEDTQKDILELFELLANTMEEKEKQEDIPAYVYLFKNLKFYIHFKKGEMGKQEELEQLDFKNLTSASQVAIMRLKLMCLKNFRINPKLLGTVQKLVEMEPHNAKWHYYSYYFLRDSRRKVSIKKTVTPMEVEAITKTIDIEKNNTIFMVTGLQCLAERTRIFSDAKLNRTPLQWGVELFSSQTEIVDFLKKQTKLLLQAPDVPAFCFSVLGAIFSSFLPGPLTDFDLAENCLKKAMEMTPDSSRMNHRMGVFIWKKEHDLHTASFYLQRASALGPQNFHSRLDLIYLLLSKPKEQQDTIAQCFEEVMDKNTGCTWDNKELSELNFLKGCFIMMTNGDKKEVIKLWIKAYNLCPTENHFPNIASQAARFMWDQTEFNFVNCKYIIFSDLDNDSVDEEVKKILTDILMNITAQEQQKSHYKKKIQGNSSRQAGETSWLFKRNYH